MNDRELMQQALAELERAYTIGIREFCFGVVNLGVIESLRTRLSEPEGVSGESAYTFTQADKDLIADLQVMAEDRSERSTFWKRADAIGAIRLIGRLQAALASAPRSAGVLEATNTLNEETMRCMVAKLATAERVKAQLVDALKHSLFVAEQLADGILERIVLEALAAAGVEE